MKHNSGLCASDDNSESKSNSKLPDSLSAKVEHGTSESVDGSLVDDSKRNSLMNYFIKVSKEEALAKEEKIEMKVKVLVHSPPTTPSKKLRRRSIQSLPGGAACLNKKKNSLKNKLKESINAIEVICVEDLKDNDSTERDAQSSNPISKTSSSTLNRSEDQSSQNRLSLTNLVDSVDKFTSKANSKSLSRGKPKKEGKRDSIVKISTPLEKSEIVDDECLAVPLNHEKNDTTELKTLSNPRTPWKLRVCLNPVQLPSTRGTLLEEDSDCDDVFLTRRDKKRKLEKQKDSVTLPVKVHKAPCAQGTASSPDIIFEKKTSGTVKIAPLFTRKLDTQARQLFLQSGVPDQVKRVFETQRSFEEQDAEIFPKESHIQQRNEEWVWKLPVAKIPLRDHSVADIPKPSGKFNLSAVSGGSDILLEVDRVNSASCKGPEMRSVFSLPLDVVKPILRLIKQESPDFKVVNTFKALRTKFQEEELSNATALSVLYDLQKSRRKSTQKKSSSSKSTSLLPTYRARLWTEKYKPSTANEIVGNTNSVQQLKRWLEAWRKASEDVNNLCKLNVKEEMKRKRKRKGLPDDDDDFVVSDNSSDTMLQSDSPVGIAVLYGPSGSGKTSTVYALAKDLGYKVLEVNASEKRNGKLVLSKLSEATQSHQVQQGSTAEQGFQALFSKSTTKKKIPPSKEPRPDQEEDRAKKMSLILFEDVDIVFEEEDEGFLSAIANLVSSSKRPVILTTNDPESLMVNRFMTSNNLILNFECPVNLTSTWLQIVSILEGIYAAPDAVRDLVAVCKGDFRRALLQMQLWVKSGANNLPMPLTYSRKTKKSSKNDDDFSEIEDEGDCSSPCIPANTDCIAAMLGKYNSDEDTSNSQKNKDSSIKVPYPLDLGLYWWNIPPILSLKQLEHELPEKLKESSPTIVSGQKRMLDESFIASFCTDDGSSTDNNANEDSDVICSQGTRESQGSDDQEMPPITQESNCSDLTSYQSYCTQEEMFATLYQFNIMSTIDIVAVHSQLSHPSYIEPVSRFFNPLLKDSLSLVKVENDSPNSVHHSTTEDLCHWLAEQSLNQTRINLKVDPSSLRQTYNHCLPSQEELRWRCAHAETEQVALSALPTSMYLERRAIATDYLPTLRLFCRLERSRSIINTKRRNRFYHYLKSLGSHPTEAQLEILCDTMSSL